MKLPAAAAVQLLLSASPFCNQRCADAFVAPRSATVPANIQSSAFAAHHYHGSDTALDAGALKGALLLSRPLRVAPVASSAATASAYVTALHATAESNDEDEIDNDADDESNDQKPSNPYADPNYPDLEFVNYDDPSYQIDMGIGDDFATPAEEARISSALTEEEANAAIEDMREDRRRRNDEYQFETYHASALRGGDQFMGEWEVYRTSSFMKGKEGRVNEYGMPSLVKAKKVLKMIATGKKVKVESDSERSCDGERIVHEETVFEEEEDGEDGGEGEGETSEAMAEAIAFEKEIQSNTYWPEQLGPYDFRGEQGIMVVGNAYTICDAVPLSGGNSLSGDDSQDGPFSELRTELGIFHKKMRLRLKLDYRIKDSDKAKNDGSNNNPFPPLSLRSMTVCREGHERWPRYDPGRTDVDHAATAALFGPPGAAGGLYDPPPVGGEEQSLKYMMLDLDGGATALFPHTMDQDPEAFGGNGWVTSLDWTPGAIRYQVDRKVLGGTKIKGLKTLELSEVQGAEADTYRPKDGGADMRQ